MLGPIVPYYNYTRTCCPIIESIGYIGMYSPIFVNQMNRGFPPYTPAEENPYS